MGQGDNAFPTVAVGVASQVAPPSTETLMVYVRAVAAVFAGKASVAFTLEAVPLGVCVYKAEPALLRNAATLTFAGTRSLPAMVIVLLPPPCAIDVGFAVMLVIVASSGGCASRKTGNCLL